jgi:hypothetical protein
MKNITIANLTKGGRIEKAIKKRFPFASPGAVGVLIADLRGLVDPVLRQLHEEAKEWERHSARSEDEAGAAWSEVDSLQADIKRMEAETIRQEWLKQFYSY